MIPPKQRKKVTAPRTSPCILLSYEGNTNYRILLEDGRIIGTHAEFQEVLTTPSTQDGSLEAIADATVGSRTVGFPNQPLSNIRHASVPASGRQISMEPPEHVLNQPSNDNSQPVVA
jgi:hypothetical protein